MESASSALAPFGAEKPLAEVVGVVDDALAPGPVAADALTEATGHSEAV